MWQDTDGWWAVLKPGWAIDGAKGTREDTKKGLLARIRRDAVKAPEQ